MQGTTGLLARAVRSCKGYHYTFSKCVERCEGNVLRASGHLQGDPMNIFNQFFGGGGDPFGGGSGGGRGHAGGG